MDEDDCLFQLIYCIVGALLFLLGTGWVKFSLITKIRRYFSSTQRQINDLQVEIQQHRAEIAKIPIMDQFAANRKKQRIIDKLTDNLKELSKFFITFIYLHHINFSSETGQTGNDI
jgi:predicted PurR-regulated permease PerM